MRSAGANGDVIVGMGERGWGPGQAASSANTRNDAVSAEYCQYSQYCELSQ
jgi:hypothetical protein